MHFLLWKKGSHQSPNFDTFKGSGENLPNSSCCFPKHKSVFLQILYHSSISWKITLLHFFRPKSIYFEQKESIKMQIFEAFKCSCQNSSRSCHFWNKKLVFLQILSYQSTNLVRFLVSSQNFETLHFDRLLLSKSYTISAKKWHWRVMQS